MKIFVAYKFTGEDKKELEETMNKICSCLKEKHDVNCTALEKWLWDKSYNESLGWAFKKIAKAKHLFVFINSNEKSEGALLEVGYAMAKRKKIVLLIKKNIQSTLKFFADKIIEFDNLDDLLNKLKEI